MSTSHSPNEPFLLGDWTVEPTAGTLRRGGTLRRLRPQEMDLLVALAERRGRVVPHEELMTTIWRGAVVEEGALARCVSLIRKALGDQARQPRFIETVPKRGYRLIADVRWSPDSLRASGREPAVAPPRHQPLSPADGRWRWLTLSLLVVGAVGWLGWQSWRDSPQAGVAPVLEAEAPTVAVRSFEDLSGREELAWLSRGLAEMVATELALSPRAQLLPRELVEGRGSEPGTPPAELGAALEVRGSFLVEGNGIRLDLQLREVEGGRVVAGVVEGGELSDLAGLVRQAGSSLRQRLPGAADDGGEERAALPDDPEAIRLYTDGLLQLGHFRPRAARESFERALAIQPDQPFTQLALADALQSLGRAREASEVATSARAASARLPVNQRLWIEARSLGVAARWKEASVVFRRLWDAFPENLEYGLGYTNSLTQARDFHGALEALAELRGRLGPGDLDPRIDYHEALTARLMGRQERARGAAERAAAGARQRSDVHLEARALHLLGASLYALDLPDEAMAKQLRSLESFRAVGDQRGIAWCQTMLGRWSYHEGKLTAADEHFADALATFQGSGDEKAAAVVSRQRAEVDLVRQRNQPALEALESALATFQALNDDFEQAQTYNSLGIAFNQLGRRAEAVEAYTQAHALYRRTGNQEMEASTLYNLATVQMSQGRWRDAAERFRQTEVSFRDLGNRYALANVLFSVSLSGMYLGNLEAAEQAAVESVALAREIQNPRLLAQCLIQRSRVFSLRGHHGEALAAADELGKILGDLDEPGFEAEGQRAMYRVRFAAGEGEAAAVAIRRAMALHEDSYRDPYFLARALLAAGRPVAASRALPGGEIAGGPVDLIENSLIIADVRRANGQPSAARDLLLRALPLAKEGGLWWLVVQTEGRLLLLDLQEREDPAAAERLITLLEELRSRSYEMSASWLEGELRRLPPGRAPGFAAEELD
ncbi:MAG: tetratricopeptide repeat protein [Acidobacteriota bacterium]